MTRSLTLAAGALALAIVALVASSGTVSAQQSIAVGDIYFCDPSFENGVCTTTVTAGDTVSWDFSAASIAHTTTGSLWDSGFVDDGGTFSFTFSEPGTYAYQCNVHPTQMRGQIIVQAAPAPEPQPTVPVGGEDPSPVATTPPIVEPPVTGFGPGERSSSNAWLVALAVAGAALVTIGAAGYRLARR